VKLKIDMLKMSKGSCLGARGRKGLRVLFLKLFSRCLAFMVISICLMLIDRSPVTTLQWRDFRVPLSREDVSLAESVDAC
jgi:hypothetical protein